MDGFAGIVVLLIIFGLVQKFSRKAQANRNTPEAPQPRHAPSKPAKAVPGHASQSVEEMVAAFSEAFLKDNPPRTAAAAQPPRWASVFSTGRGAASYPPASRWWTSRMSTSPAAIRRWTPFP